MAAQAGRDLLLKCDATGSGGFVTMAGLKARRIALNAGSVDITDGDSFGRWRELLAGAGTRSASVSGGGVFRDKAADETVRTMFFDGTIRAWQVVVPDFGTIAGPFQVSALDYAGTHDGEVTYELALESAGEISFTAS